MKFHKTISISDWIAEKLLKEDNASGLINELLINHFKDQDKSEEEIIDDVKNKIEEKAKAQRSFNNLKDPKYIKKKLKEWKELKEKKV